MPWAPPEVLYVQGDATPQLAERGDVYSLAATLWQLLVGRSPFEVPGGDNSAYALMPRIRTHPVSPTGRPDVPPSLERILAQAMAKDPALAAAFRRQVESDPAFAKNPHARLEFFARRHASWDERLNLYPVMRTDSAL